MTNLTPKFKRIHAIGAIVALVLFIFCSLFIHSSWVYADELSDVESKLADLKRAFEQSKAATTPLVSSYTKLQSQLADIQKRIGVVENEVERKAKEVAEGDVVLGDQQNILEQRVRVFYKRSYYFSPISALFSKRSLADFARELAYQRQITSEDKKTIAAVVLYIKDLEEKKKALEGERIRLAVVKQETDKQSQFLQTEIAGAKAFQTKLAGEIATLSQRQQQILAQKLASLNLPTSLGGGQLYCTDDKKLDPGFRPAFAFFTFGIPHRVGLNQYGALGRARAGQSYQDILRAYFDSISFEKRDANTKIKVQGYGERPLDEYLLGIYEMPGDWPMEALKAQAVAARSYALAYTDNGAKEICTTQACQVYKGGNKGGNWEAAVKATTGEVMVSGGQVISAWYASTAGGYTFLSTDVGWGNRSWTKRLRDTQGDVNSFSDLFQKAYDRDSPCFYAAQGYRSEYAKSAWLKAEEVADIVNVLLLAKQDSGTQNHLSQVDRSNPDGVETWNVERVRGELKNRGISPYTSVSDFSIDWDKGLGKTTNITVGGDGGNKSFSGDEFKNFFNLRAPANIQIVGPLFNVEKK